MMPTFDALAVPTLAVLDAHADGLRRAALFDPVARQVGLDDATRQQRNPAGDNVFDSRVGWALSWLKGNGWVVNPRRGHWQITDAGRARLRSGVPITAEEMRPLVDRRAKPLVDGLEAIHSDATLTPVERIDAAVDEIVEDVQRLVLERLQAASPLFFERAVLKLLATMGYAGTLGQAEHAGRSGDGGIDGVLYLDRLHLERVYVQAKRWAGNVSAATVRDFAGAMDGENAAKGVILTTSGFTRDAVAYIQRSPKAIRLVDGAEVARLMVEFGVGVSRAEVRVLPRLDEDFFDDA